KWEKILFLKIIKEPQMELYFYNFHTLFSPYPLYLSLLISLEEFIEERLPTLSFSSSHQNFNLKIQKKYLFYYGLLWNGHIRHSNTQHIFRYGFSFTLPKPPLAIHFENKWLSHLKKKNMTKNDPLFPIPKHFYLYWKFQESMEGKDFFLEFFPPFQKKNKKWMMEFNFSLGMIKKKKNSLYVLKEDSSIPPVPISFHWFSKKKFILKKPILEGGYTFTRKWRSFLRLNQLFFASWWETPFHYQKDFKLHLKVSSLTSKEVSNKLEKIAEVFEDFQRY
ncbi:MAG: hypothetical protein D6785_15915, partial [Planctomycetota bacterium]